MRRKFYDLTGSRFGRLVVLGRGGLHKNHRLWRCLCDCGQETGVIGVNLKKGSTTSCGCFRRENQSAIQKVRGLKHGHARNGARSPEHQAWVDMRLRCTAPTCRFFEHYGGRGISVCARWDDYAAFLADMGPRPSPKHSIDRIDVNGNYEPSNCRWATRDVQQHNVRARSVTGHSNIGWSDQRQRYVWAVSRAGKKLRGRCRTLDEAIAARDAANLELYGEAA